MGVLMRILIVDDHPTIIAACAAMLTDQIDIDEVFEAPDAEAGFTAYIRNSPDVTVVDISLPRASGFELTRRILRHDPSARVVVFSMYDDAIFAARAIEVGAKGFVTKNGDPYRLVDAIRKANDGGFFLTPKLSDRLVHEKANNPDRYGKFKAGEAIHLAVRLQIHATHIALQRWFFGAIDNAYSICMSGLRRRS